MDPANLNYEVTCNKLLPTSLIVYTFVIQQPTKIPKHEHVCKRCREKWFFSVFLNKCIVKHCRRNVVS